MCMNCFKHLPALPLQHVTIRGDGFNGRIQVALSAPTPAFGI
jgi:hypothetical protein